MRPGAVLASDRPHLRQRRRRATVAIVVAYFAVLGIAFVVLVWIGS